MSKPNYTCPIPRSREIDTFFLEHRAKLLDIAAFLDRVDRCDPGHDDRKDHRIIGLKRAIDILRDGKPHRTKRMLELLSDPTLDPIESANGQGASGVYLGFLDQGNDSDEELLAEST